MFYIDIFCFISKFVLFRFVRIDFAPLRQFCKMLLRYVDRCMIWRFIDLKMAAVRHVGFLQGYFICFLLCLEQHFSYYDKFATYISDCCRVIKHYRFSKWQRLPLCIVTNSKFWFPPRFGVARCVVCSKSCCEALNRCRYFLVPWPSVDFHWKFHGHRPRGTPPSGGLNAKGVAKYRDFWHFEGNISQTVQDSK